MNELRFFGHVVITIIKTFGLIRIIGPTGFYDAKFNITV